MIIFKSQIPKSKIPPKADPPTAENPNIEIPMNKNGGFGHWAIGHRNIIWSLGFGAWNLT